MSTKPPAFSRLSLVAIVVLFSVVSARHASADAEMASDAYSADDDNSGSGTASTSTGDCEEGSEASRC